MDNKTERAMKKNNAKKYFKSYQILRDEVINATSERSNTTTYCPLSAGKLAYSWT